VSVCAPLAPRLRAVAEERGHRGGAASAVPEGEGRAGGSSRNGRREFVRGCGGAGDVPPPARRGSAAMALLLHEKQKLKGFS